MKTFFLLLFKIVPLKSEELMFFLQPSMAPSQSPSILYQKTSSNNRFIQISFVIFCLIIVILCYVVTPLCQLLYIKSHRTPRIKPELTNDESSFNDIENIANN